MRFAVDIGGTFTDVTAFDPQTGRVQLGKALGTPPALQDAVFNAVDASGADLAGAESVIHGSTIVINALLERRGARTALITTAGFRDVYEIGRINRPDAFNLFFRKHVPLVPRDHIFEISERLLANGEVLRPFPEPEARALARHLRETGVEAVAIVFLHSYVNPEHEAVMRRVLAEEAPGIYATASHELSREYREYERTATTVANAYVGPTVSRYLGDLEGRLRDRGFERELMIMQSTGGLFDVATVKRQCVQMVESGPAGGVRGTIALCDELAWPAAIAFDMGGTTAKACVVRDGATALSPQYFVGGYEEGHPIRVPVLDINEVGTGGGSIAYVDDGALRVGPRSAGAVPGPVCYARGGVEPTITDANIVLGRLAASAFLGGEMTLDADAAHKAVQDRVGRPLGMDAVAAALGVVSIAVASMANAVRAVTTERGLDPRQFPLVVYGGAGPLHGAMVAAQLAISKVIVPRAPGHFSALGMLHADFRRDLVQTVITPLDDLVPDALEALFRNLEVDAVAEVSAAGIADHRIVRERSADMRYRGQEHAISVPVPASIDSRETMDAIHDAFHELHQAEFRHSAPDQRVELVSLRAAAVGVLDKPSWPRVSVNPTPARPERRPVWFDASGAHDCLTLHRDDLKVDDRQQGPLIVQEMGSATVVPPGAALTMDGHGNLHIDLER